MTPSRIHTAMMATDRARRAAKALGAGDATLAALDDAALLLTECQLFAQAVADADGENPPAEAATRLLSAVVGFRLEARAKPAAFTTDLKGYAFEALLGKATEGEAE